MSQTNKQQEKTVLRRRLNGTVVSDRMDKTVVVVVDQVRVHPRYGKRYRVTKRYKAHDEDNQFKAGDAVSIEAIRPLSKEKRWTVVIPSTK